MDVGNASRNGDGSAVAGTPWLPARARVLRERITGAVCSVAAHAAVAALLLSVPLFAPTREAPALREIPVEIVVEPAHPTLAIIADPSELERAPASSTMSDADSTLQTSANDAATVPEPTQRDRVAAVERSAGAVPNKARTPDQANATAMAAPEIGRDPPSARPAADPIASTPAPSPPPAPAARAPPHLAPAAANGAARRIPSATRALNNSAETAAERSKRRIARHRDALRRDAADAMQRVQRPPARLRAQLAALGPGPGIREGRARVTAPSPSTYRAQVIAHLTRFKRYPVSAEARGAEGTPAVSFALDGNGRVISASVAKSSGHADIDAETLAMVRRAVPFPPPPVGAPHAFSVTIAFHLR